MLGRVQTDIIMRTILIIYSSSCKVGNSWFRCDDAEVIEI